MTKIAYLDCASGISGDMMLGALIDAGIRVEQLQPGLDSLGLPGCKLVSVEVNKLGFRATQVSVEYRAEHAHRHLSQILAMIDGSILSQRQRELATRMFRSLAEAEARVHGTSVEKVHFHEVGAADSIADLVCSAIAWDLLGAESVVCSPIPTGGGSLKIAHGLVRVPAPATAELLRGVPLEASSVEAELTTPTGAVIATTMADRFGSLPSMTIETIGYGAGQRDLEDRPNVLRLLVGQAAECSTRECIQVLETNLDDATGELVAHAAERLMEAGALDVYTTPIQMKKNRPAVKLTVLCHDHLAAALEQMIFRETTTLGVRRWTADRRVLPRRTCQVQTAWGAVEGKLALLEDGSTRFSPEYEACRRLAEKHQQPLSEIYEAARRAFDLSVDQP